jgi:hypothetical protein
VCNVLNYRLYRLDGAGKIAKGDWIQAADDEEARRKALEHVDSASFELWDRNRLVAKVVGRANGAES